MGVKLAHGTQVVFFCNTQLIYFSGTDKRAIIGSMAGEQVNGRALNKVDICVVVLCCSPLPHLAHTVTICAALKQKKEAIRTIRSHSTPLSPSLAFLYSSSDLPTNN